MIYYHYTTKEAYDEIKRTGQFVPSMFSMALDAKYGPGWYFTDLHPDKKNEELYPLWGGPEPTKVQYYLEFEIETSILQYCRSNVYKLPHESVNAAHLNTAQTYNQGNKIVLAFKRFGDRIRKFLGL